MLRDRVLPLLVERERSQAWLARKVGVDPALLHHWLTGKRPVTQKRIDQMALALGVSIDDLNPEGTEAAA